MESIDDFPQAGHSVATLPMSDFIEEIIMNKPCGINPLKLYSATQLYPTPDFVKSASPSEVGVSATNQDRELYADPNNFALPCYSPASTWASYATWKEANFDREDPEAVRIETAILKFARHYEIFQDCKKLAYAIRDERDKLHKVADEGGLPDEAFAVVWTNQDGKVERHMPMRNDLEVAKAASYFHQHLPLFISGAPFEYRQTVATKILEKAAAFDAAIPSEAVVTLTQCAGFGMCVPSTTVSSLLKRADIYKQSKKAEVRQAADVLEHLATSLKTAASNFTHPAFRTEIATVIDQMDKLAGISDRVASGQIPSPEKILFDMPLSKMAEAVTSHTATITGEIYKLADVERLPVSQVRSFLGDDIAKAMSDDGVFINGSKAAQVIPTLPRPDAKLFDQLMTEHGYAAVTKSAQETKISNQFLHALRAEKPGG
jgi:hypothetical protein